ncbi:O-antigen polymerase [Bacillus sp. FJAT-22090]|uniref:O-antigen polymerase n=1 Tax=Bacillus sp. FJAT-22090 TaxID=1581038 RepID=UPI0011AAF81B|nr:O-antigen polymerase [Bacillus sp. FJAT-22090]
MNQRISGLTSNITPLLTYIYAYSRTLIFPLYFSFLSILFAKKKIGKWHYFLIMLTGIFFCLSTTAKSPVVIFMISGLFGYNFAIEGRLKIKKITMGIIIVLLIPAAIYPLLYGSSGLNSMIVLIDSLWRRLTWVPSYASGVYFDYFSNHNLSMGFSSNKVLSFFTGQEYINIPSYIYENYFNTTIQGGLVNASYFASFYADWGLYGVIFSTIFISMFLVSLDYFFKLNTTFLYTAGKVIVLLGMIHLMLSNFYSVSLGRGFVSIPLLFLLLKIISTQKNYFSVKDSVYKGVKHEI